ncbi:MAG: ferritin family protein [Chloroflexi bacterium]|nr:ferritin family protein [Chloroflexota bacterium]
MAADPTIKNILDTALEREKKGHDFYLKAAAATDSDKAKRMFLWLVSVEQTHIDKLSRQIESLDTTSSFTGMAHPSPPRVTRSDLPPAPEASGPVKADAGELDALSLGMKAEKEAAAFYAKAAADAGDPEASALLNHLAADEQEHLAVLEEEYNWLKRSGEYFTIHRFQIPAR